MRKQTRRYCHLSISEINHILTTMKKIKKLEMARKRKTRKKK